MVSPKEGLGAKILKIYHSCQGCMNVAETAEIPSLLVSTSGAIREGKFEAVWVLDVSNSNSQTRDVSNSTTNS